MVSYSFAPQHLVSREAELQQMCQILAQDGDCLVAGVPGSGRRTLIRMAAQQVGARLLIIDCLRATNGYRFLQLLADGITEVFAAPAELALIQQWSTDQPLTLETSPSQRARLVWHPAPGKDWALFQTLLALPQLMAEWLDCRVVLVFQNFPHMRSWDRMGKWEAYLRQEIQRQSRVSYALVATVAEPWVYASNVEVISLTPLSDEDLQPWIINAMSSVDLQFEADGLALKLFLSYVQGHVGDAIALARRIWLDRLAFDKGDSASVIQAHHVHRSALALVEDLSFMYESLILLLPPSQVRVLESLALDPTDSPHARNYIQKHQLSRGGGLQGALNSLEQKGLVYGPKYGYRIAMPLLAFWLKQRLA